MKTNEDILPYCQRQKYLPETVVSGNRRFMRIFALRFACEELSINSGVVEGDQFSVALSSEPLQIRAKLS